MARQIFLLDLKDEAIAAEYEDWHMPGRVPARVPSVTNTSPSAFVNRTRS